MQNGRRHCHVVWVQLVGRGGVQQRVPTRELVPGEVLVLSEGDTVAADARLLSAAASTVSEASLTGESEPTLEDARTLPEPAALADRSTWSSTAPRSPRRSGGRW